MTTAPAHPAPFSEALYPRFAEALDWCRPPARRHLLVLDPFAGEGGIFRLADYTDRPLRIYGVELEPEWAAAQGNLVEPRLGKSGMIVGDATKLPSRWTDTFDAVITSPCYGNRMADAHDARDACSECEGLAAVWEWPIMERGAHVGWTDECPKCHGTGLSPRRTYRAFLGRMPTAGSAATMQWGDEYRDLHERAWLEARRVLRPGGVLVVNVKDHVRAGKIVRVSAWHNRTILALGGFDPLRAERVACPGFRHGENGEARVTHEKIYTYRKVGR